MIGGHDSIVDDSIKRVACLNLCIKSLTGCFPCAIIVVSYAGSHWLVTFFTVQSYVNGKKTILHLVDVVTSKKPHRNI